MLNLYVPINATSVEAVKKYLWSELASVKSSHRVEAIARGLGFKSYAAMLHTAKSGSHTLSRADGSRFSLYLHEHGFGVEPIHLYRAVARMAVAVVLANTSRLSANGYGFHRPRWDADKKRYETTEEQYAKFTQNRAELLSKYGLDEFLLAFALTQKIPPTKTVRRVGSYRLKHIAERMPFTLIDGTELGPRYVSNGALIAAALYAGFRMKTYVDHLGYDEINVSFNMSKRVVDDLDCEIRPRGDLARHRAWLVERRKYRTYYRGGQSEVYTA